VESRRVKINSHTDPYQTIERAILEYRYAIAKHQLFLLKRGNSKLTKKHAMSVPPRAGLEPKT
ncbi:hypothetical protein ACFLYR_08670, partial [Chloroflexota bacterium]